MPRAIAQVWPHSGRWLNMDISTISAAVPQAQVRADVSMAILDKTLETARSNAVSLLEVLPDANPAEGNSFDGYA